MSYSLFCHVNNGVNGKMFSVALWLPLSASASQNNHRKLKAALSHGRHTFTQSHNNTHALFHGRSHFRQRTLRRSFAPEPVPTQSRSACSHSVASRSWRRTRRHYSAEVTELNFNPHLVKQLLPCRVGLDGKLQLGVHGGDAHVDLQDIREAC